jgi:hypothetical protein
LRCSFWINKFTAADSSYSDWIQVGSAATINAEGFTMKGTSGTDNTTIDGVKNNSGSAQRYDFRGKPNDGTIDIPVLLDN